MPDATEPLPLAIEADRSNQIANSKSPPSTTEDKPVGRMLSYTDTRRAGLYRLNWEAEPGGAENDLFAVNPDLREGDLTSISADDLRSLWGELQPEIVAADHADANATARGQEIWRPLAMSLLALMALEACFATWVGRQR